MKSKLSIVKIGGNIIENDAELSRLLKLFADIKGHKILVHGGGNRASQIGKKLGIEAQMHRGRRITDGQSLEVVVMVYAGLISKSLVAALQGYGCNAIGLSGADGNSILAHKRVVKDIDYGFAGDIDHVNVKAVTSLLEAKFVPVFCALTHNGSGQLLNTNADTIASEIAIGMSRSYETSLFYCFDKKGVLRDISDEQSVIKEIDDQSYKVLLGENAIADGMLPKLQNAFHALSQNVSKICIGDTDMLQPGATLFTTIKL